MQKIVSFWSKYLNIIIFFCCGITWVEQNICFDPVTCNYLVFIQMLYKSFRNGMMVHRMGKLPYYFRQQKKNLSLVYVKPASHHLITTDLINLFTIANTVVFPEI